MTKLLEGGVYDAARAPLAPPTPHSITLFIRLSAKTANVQSLNVDGFYRSA